MDDCIFCKIVRGEIPAYKVYEDDEVLAFLDIAGDVWGHTLVVPKKHCVNVLDCDSETFGKVMEATRKISVHYVENCGIGGINIVNANNDCAQQSVFHLHIHVIPRKPGDGVDIWGFQKKHEFDFEEMRASLIMPEK